MCRKARSPYRFSSFLSSYFPEKSGGVFSGGWHVFLQLKFGRFIGESVLFLLFLLMDFLGF